MTKADHMRIIGSANNIGITSKFTYEDIVDKVEVEMNYIEGRFGPIIVKSLKNEMLKPLVSPPDIGKFMEKKKSKREFGNHTEGYENDYNILIHCNDSEEIDQVAQVADQVFASVSDTDYEGDVTTLMRSIITSDANDDENSVPSNTEIVVDAQMMEWAAHTNQLDKMDVDQNIEEINEIRNDHVQYHMVKEFESIGTSFDHVEYEPECQNVLIEQGLNGEEPSSNLQQYMCDIISDEHMPDSRESSVALENDTHLRLENNDFRSMLNAVRLTVNKNRQVIWNEMSEEVFKEKFVTTHSIRNEFTAYELRLCAESVKDKFSMAFTKDTKKCDLVKLFTEILGFENKRKTRSKLRSPRKLKYIIKDVFNKLFTKEATNVIIATNEFLKSVPIWQSDNVFGKSINIENEEYIWYSKPEVIPKLQTEIFALLDCHHIFVNARCKICSHGIPGMGLSKQAWLSVAKRCNENKTGLTLAMVEDLIDRQSNSFAQTTFNEKVEEKMIALGWPNEAEFCKDIRNWYRAEDEPGLSAKTRHCFRLKMRERLLNLINFSKFPPPGNHISGMPIVMFEGILTNIDRRIQLYRFVESYNVPSLGTLDSENFFSAFQDLDPKGTGVLMADDIPIAIESASYIYQNQIDAERPFFLRTTAAKVYPLHPRLIEDRQDIETSDNTVNYEKENNVSSYEINLRDHAFDEPSKGNRRKPKRKRGSISAIDLPSKGTQGVRQYHRNDESKILPHKRLGIQME